MQRRGSWCVDRSGHCTLTINKSVAPCTQPKPAESPAHWVECKEERLLLQRGPPHSTYFSRITACQSPFNSGRSPLALRPLATLDRGAFFPASASKPATGGLRPCYFFSVALWRGECQPGTCCDVLSGVATPEQAVARTGDPAPGRRLSRSTWRVQPAEAVQAPRQPVRAVRRRAPRSLRCGLFNGGSPLLAVPSDGRQGELGRVNHNPKMVKHLRSHHQGTR